jgi:ADP-ribose pyrophosphatase YjhB (NUDIX family)
MEYVSTKRYYCPQCGVDALESLDNKLYGCSRCGHTYFHNTAVAVSAVIEHEGRIAWITRAREPGAGLLDLPGGFVERDESLEEAVLRETREETGFTPCEPRYLFSIPNRYIFHGVRYSTVDVFFGCRLLDSGHFVPNDEASNLEWMRPESVDLGRIAFESTRLALAKLLKP